MRTLTIATAALLLAPLAAATTTTHERNLDFLWSLVGPHDPATPATLHDGRTMTLAAAIDDAAARAGSVDLGAMTHSAVSPTPVPTPAPVGDVWVIEVGEAGCDDIYAPVHQPFFYVGDPQLWIYPGYIGQMSTTQGDTTAIIGWSVKSSVLAHGTGGFTATGLTDFYCFEYQGRHFAFPYVDGEAHINLGGSP